VANSAALPASTRGKAAGGYQPDHRPPLLLNISAQQNFVNQRFAPEFSDRWMVRSPSHVFAFV
jgi:hypothetical protein